MILVILLAFISIVLESSIISIPLTAVVLTTFSFFYKKESFLIFSLFAGIILDTLALRTIGISSLFFLSLSFLIYLYEKKIESTTAVIFIVNFISSLLYTLLIKGNISFYAPLVASLLAVLLFSVFNKLKEIPFKEKKLSFEI